MRKNFLLLFLIAMLPLAGWAQIDISQFTIQISGTGAWEYNGTAQGSSVSLNVQKENATTPLTEGTDYTVQLYDADKAEITAAKFLDAGRYYVAAKGKGNYSGVTSMLAIDMTPKPLSATNCGVATTGGPFTYDGTAKTFTTVVLSDNALKINLTEGSNKDYTMEYKDNINATYGSNNPRIVFTGHGNYQGEYAYTFTINQIGLPSLSTDGAYTFTKVSKNPIYSGTETTTLPTIVVKDGKTTLTEGTDFEIKWYDASNNEVTKVVSKKTVSSKPVHAGTYTAKVYGIGNYAAGSGITDATKGKEWQLTVDKKALMVYVQDFEKVYDANAADLSKVTVVFNGLLEVDKALDTDVTAAWKTSGTYTNVGQYIMIPSWSPTASITNDYTLTNPTEGIYTIKQREVTVTALDQKFTYDGTDQTKNLNTAKDNTTFKFEKAEEGKETGVLGTDDITSLFEIKLKDGVVIKEQNNAAYTGAIQIVDPQPTKTKTAKQIAAELAAANYKIKGVAGNVVVEGKNLILIAGSFTKEYGYTIDFSKDFNVVNNAGIKTWKTTPTYKVTDAKGNEVTAESGVLPIGTYTIEITNSEAIVPSENFKFKKDSEHLFTGELTISKKNLEITINTVNLNTGDGIDELKKYATVKAYDKVGDDVIAFTFAFDSKLALTTSGKLKAASNYTLNKDGIIENAVTATADVSTKEAPNDNDKYIISFVKGGIKLGAAKSLYLDRTDAQLVGKISDAAADASKYDVTFSAKTLDKNQWYTMVLPFDVEMTELVNNLQYIVTPATKTTPVVTGASYAIVNVLSASSNLKHIAFKLEMQKIPANTPFLIKTAEDVVLDLSGFAGKKIAVPEEFDGTVSSVSTDGNIKYIGVYKATSIQTTDETKQEWMAQPGVLNAKGVAYTDNAWKSWKSKAKDLTALECYLEFPIVDGAAAPIITIEDIDLDGTTVIKTLNAETMQATAVDGWYTLNGVKLQGAPTQKGIYINNGKKVVIK